MLAAQLQSAMIRFPPNRMLAAQLQSAMIRCPPE